MKPVSLPELQALLGKLRITTNPAELAQAHGRTVKVQPQAHPLEQLRQLLSDAGLKDIQAAILPWRRLDPRRLPALLWFEDEWWLAERLAPGQIALSRDGAAARECTEDALHEAAVLWLRPRHGAEATMRPKTMATLRCIWSGRSCCTAGAGFRAWSWPRFW
jgi:ATP-binding cassette subfamily C protein LapB